MPLISDNYNDKKLKKYGINIKTKYIVDNKILERNTNNSINDDVINGIIFEKEYYINDKLVNTEKDFDSRIEYTFISKEMENKIYKCKNCGLASKLGNFVDGCPYCKTQYNIDYSDKDLGSKYHYERVLRSNKYRIITGVIDIVISIILAFLFLKGTSRTFNAVDISKVFVYGLILSLLLYYLFYILDAYIVLLPIKRYKDKQNQKQIVFWNNTKLDKKEFYNNLNYEISKYYYKMDNIIDYDIIDYDEFNYYEKSNNNYISVKVLVRIIEYLNGKLISTTRSEKYVMRENKKKVLEIKDGINYMKCPNCSSSIDVVNGKCSYCDYEIDYLQKWILDK